MLFAKKIRFMFAKTTTPNQPKNHPGLTSKKSQTPTTPQPAKQISQSLVPKTPNTSLDKYRYYKTAGPELMVSKILMINGSLTTKQIWRCYERMAKEDKQKGTSEKVADFKSLTYLKKILKCMRINQKVKSAGYSHKTKVFNGWKIQEKRALKYTHPEVVTKIKSEIEKRNIL